MYNKIQGIYISVTLNWFDKPRKVIKRLSRLRSEVT